MPELTPAQEKILLTKTTSQEQILLPNCLVNRLTSSWRSRDQCRQTKGDWRIWLGKAGETLAVAFLERKGWSIEARNWRAGRYAEIDIVALAPSGLRVFVEVKTRRQNNIAKDLDSTGFEAIDRIRQQKIITSARMYLARNSIVNSSCRFDVIAVQWQISPNPSLAMPLSMPEIVHVESAFPG